MYKVFQTVVTARDDCNIDWSQRLVTFRCRQVFVGCLFVLISMNCAAAGDKPIRFASWNIANFHHKSGFEARRDIGTRRYAADFASLQIYAEKVDADVVALQEIVTERAARLLYPAADYWLLMSSRYEPEKSQGGEDIYTALAIKKNRGIKILERRDLAELEVRPSSSHSKHRPTRRGTAALLAIDGKPIWVMSVHLKSSCPKVKWPQKSRQHACQLLWQQTVTLKKWINQRIANNEGFLIMGDFNRRFGQLKNYGGVWRYLNTFDGEAPLLRRFPTSELRRCATRKGKSMHPIDWFVADREFARSLNPDSYFETRWTREHTARHWQRLSDHCPIHIDMYANKMHSELQ